MAGGEHPRLPFARRLLEQGAIDAADAHIRALLTSEPEQPDALRLMGEIALRRGHAGEAAELFERIGDAGGSGAAHYARGDFAKAVPALAKAIASRPIDQRAWRLLGEALLALDARAPLEDLAGASGQEASLDPVIVAGLMVSAALAAFVADEPQACRQWLDAADRKLAGDGSEEALRALHQRAVRRLLADREERREWDVVVYVSYLDSLLSRLSPERAAASDVLYVIGDSHCLSPACLPVSFEGRPHRVRPHLVVGAKAWHLAAGMNPRPGPQRMAFGLAAARVPRGASVVISCGEIDCRADEGLHPFLQHHPDIAPADYLARFVEAYLAAVLALLEGRRVIISGTPAPPAERAPATGFTDMVRDFNEALRSAATARGLPFLDAYALSAGPDGTSNGRWHLDAFHLVPEAFGTLLETVA